MLNKIDRRKDGLFVYGIGLVDWNSTYKVFNISHNYNQISIETIEEKGFTYEPTAQDWFDLTIGEEVIVHGRVNTYRGVLQSVESGGYHIDNGNDFVVFTFDKMVNSEQSRMTKIINLRGYNGN